MCSSTLCCTGKEWLAGNSGKVKTNQGIQCPPNLSPMHWTPLHRDTAAEKALSAPGSSLRLAPGLAPCSCFLWQGKKSPEHSHLLLQQSFPWAALPGCSPLLPHAISCQKLLICSASFTVFSLDDGITCASFTTFPDTKNSCVFRASLSAVQNNLNFLLKKLLHEAPWMKCSLFFFFLSPKVSDRNPETQSITEKSFSSAESPGIHTITGKYSLLSVAVYANL